MKMLWLETNRDLIDQAIRACDVWADLVQRIYLVTPHGDAYEKVRAATRALVSPGCKMNDYYPDPWLTETNTPPVEHAAICCEAWINRVGYESIDATRFARGIAEVNAKNILVWPLHKTHLHGQKHLLDALFGTDQTVPSTSRTVFSRRYIRPLEVVQYSGRQDEYVAPHVCMLHCYSPETHPTQRIAWHASQLPAIVGALHGQNIMYNPSHKDAEKLGRILIGEGMDPDLPDLPDQPGQPDLLPENQTGYITGLGTVKHTDGG